MNKKTLLFTVALLFAGNSMAQAQGSNDDNEISVTDSKGNQEVIEFPEAMGYELDSLMNLYMAKTYLDEDEDCQMKDINPVFEKEVYIDRLSRIPSIIEMPYNDVVQREAPPLGELHARCLKLLHADIRRGARSLRASA